MAQGFEQSSGADQDRAIAAQQEIDDLLFARLEYAGTGHAHGDTAIQGLLNRGTEAVEIEIVERDGRRVQVDRRAELLGRAYQQM